MLVVMNKLLTLKAIMMRFCLRLRVTGLHNNPCGGRAVIYKQSCTIAGFRENESIPIVNYNTEAMFPQTALPLGICSG